MLFFPGGNCANEIIPYARIDTNKKNWNIKKKAVLRIKVVMRNGRLRFTVKYYKILLDLK